METKIFNQDKLKDTEIDVVVTRVKVFLINDNDEIILAQSNGGLQLPGGHVEDGESIEETVVREIREETGIELEKNAIPKPFYEIKHYTKNYKNQNINKLSKIIYYYVKSNEKINVTNTHLTDHEKENNFSLKMIHIKDFASEINKVKTNSPEEINRVIASEILEAFGYLQKIL